MDYLIYEDKPTTDIWMKCMLGIPPLALAVGSFFAMSENINAGILLLAEAAIIGIVFICIIPVAYRIYSDSIQIGFRVPWTFSIPFNTIKTLRPPCWYTVGINLPTCFSRSRALEIVRIKRMTINISPADRQAFIDHFQKAYYEWKRVNS